MVTEAGIDVVTELRDGWPDALPIAEHPSRKRWRRSQRDIDAPSEQTPRVRRKRRKVASCDEDLGTLKVDRKEAARATLEIFNSMFGDSSETVVWPGGDSDHEVIDHSYAGFSTSSDHVYRADVSHQVIRALSVNIKPTTSA